MLRAAEYRKFMTLALLASSLAGCSSAPPPAAAPPKPSAANPLGMPPEMARQINSMSPAQRASIQGSLARAAQQRGVSTSGALVPATPGK